MTPYYSQHLDVVATEWQSRACGVVCLKMLLEARGIATPSLDEMIKQGDAIGAHGPSGWIHDGLVALAHQYGAKLSRTEWRMSDTKTPDELNEEGIAFLVALLRAHRPVMVSAIKKFREENKFHMVVLVELKEESGAVAGFHYHDPDSKTKSEGENQFVSFDVFRTVWRRMAIF